MGPYPSIIGFEVEEVPLCCACASEAEEREGHPIWDDSEFDYYPVCDRCGTEIDGVLLTTDGERWLAKRNASQNDEPSAALSEDERKWYAQRYGDHYDMDRNAGLRDAPETE